MVTEAEKKHPFFSCVTYSTNLFNCLAQVTFCTSKLEPDEPAGDLFVSPMIFEVHVL